MCRGDIYSQLCHECIVNATQKLSSDSDCSFSKRAIIWYEECMVQYSNYYFFSTVAIRPGLYMWNAGNISNTKSFMALLFSTMNITAEEAVGPLTACNNKKFSTSDASVSNF
ncbi:putative Gnk2-like domain-containing protein [Medicago truncatula]|uniref:Putative Gnk2-like domain-containing protein n=1 Tax=Medicago truncatula TaxID=3880 RepID=A0A396HLJ2_MEDTR|nr:putative Gnk2-like domain-containing protein [Medicago truncatula]